jgi:hypothetical protein
MPTKQTKSNKAGKQKVNSKANKNKRLNTKSKQTKQRKEQQKRVCRSISEQSIQAERGGRNKWNQR